MELGRASSNGMAVWNKEGQRGPKNEARRLGHGCDCLRGALRLVPAWTRAAAAATVIVAFGDSLTAGSAFPGRSLSAQLEKALKARGQDVKIVNAGVSGDTAAAGSPGSIGRCLRVRAASSSSWRQRRASGASIRPPPRRLEKMIMGSGREAFPSCSPAWRRRAISARTMWTNSALYTDLAQRYDLILYPFFLDGVALDDKYLMGDGLIPMLKGWSASSKASCQRLRSCSPRQSPSLDLRRRRSRIRLRLCQESRMTNTPAQEAIPPQRVMSQLLFGKQLTASLSALARLGVADHMGARRSPPMTLRRRRRPRPVALPRDAHAGELRRVQRGAGKENSCDAARRAAQDRCPRLNAVHGGDARRLNCPCAPTSI